ncbi:FK506-binding protein 5 [Balamuthia mandrillaris]
MEEEKREEERRAALPQGAEEEEKDQDSPPTHNTTTTTTLFTELTTTTEPVGDTEELQLQRVALAEKKKEEGNQLFLSQDYERAVLRYSEALELAPEGHPCRAAFLCNRSACFLKLEKHEKVVADATAALELEPRYMKAFLRRARAKESLDSPSEALEDYKKVLEIQPEEPAAKEALERLPSLIAAKQQREQQEMLNQLKDLGNSLLGKLGLSLDNFQLQQDEKSGTYSINFKQGQQPPNK